MPAYYVATTGSDLNLGSFAAPWQTISHAVAQLIPSDTLYLRGGTYTGASNVIRSSQFTVPSGTDFGVGAITISGYPAETAIIRPPFGRSTVSLDVGSPHHLIFQNLSLDMVNNVGNGAEGIYLYTAHHIRFQNIDLNGNGARGFGVHTGDDTPFIEILYSQIHGFGDATSIPGEDGHGLYLTSSDGLFAFNQVYNNAGYGFHVYNNRVPHVDPCRNVIRNNRIYANGIVAPATAFGVVVAWGDGNQVFNNLIYGNQAGVQLYTDGQNTLLANNTIYGNWNEAIALQYYGAGIVVRNNLAFSNGSGIIDYGTGSGFTPTIDHNSTADPSFTNAGAGDFTLLPGSPAINAGVTIAAVPDDFDAHLRTGVYDLGAYEVGAVAPAGVGSVAASGTVTGRGRTLARGIGAVAAGSTVTGIGPSAARGSVVIVGTVTGRGQLPQRGAGASTILTLVSGIGTRRGQPTVLKSGKGRVTATGTVTGRGQNGVVGVGTVALAAVVTGRGTSVQSGVQSGVGSVSGALTILGTGAAAAIGVGSVLADVSISALGAAGGVGGAVAGVGSVSSTSTGTGIGALLARGVGTVAVAGEVSGAGLEGSPASTEAVGAVAATSTVSGVGAVAAIGVGAVTAEAEVTAIGAPNAPAGETAGIGAVSGVVTVSGAAGSASAGVGAVGITVTVFGVSLGGAVGSVTITCTVDGAGNCIVPACVQPILLEAA